MPPVAEVISRVAARVSPSVWRVAVRHSSRERSRSASTLGLVMIVFALVLAVDGGVKAVSTAIDAQIRAQFGADITLFASAQKPFDAAALQSVRRTPGVTSASLISTAPDAVPCGPGDATSVAPNCQVESEGSGRRARAPVRRRAQPGLLFHPEGTL